MKKAIAILLALVLALSLAACGSNAGTPASQESTASQPPASSADTPDSAPGNSGASSPAGYLTDNVDHFARDPYKISYMCLDMASPFMKAMADGLEAYGKALNYEFFGYTADHDYDAYMSQLETLADQGYDGVVLGTDASFTYRAYEMAKEFGLAFVAESEPFRDSSGKCIWPSVAQDQYGNGATTMQWLVDNYSKYWSDPIDEATLGLIILTFSPVSSIEERRPGVYDTFVKAFPGAADNVFVGDLVTTPSGFSAAGGDELVSGIVPANPQIEKWFIVGLVCDYSLGATRAIERLNKGGSTLIASIQADNFIADLESGSSGDIWVAACGTSANEATAYMAAGVVAMLDGRVTPEDLWPEWKSSPDEYALVRLQGTMITKDTYQAWLDDTSLDTLIATIPK